MSHGREGGRAHYRIICQAASTSRPNERTGNSGEANSTEQANAIQGGKRTGERE
jgi:hypothetical protein